MIRWLRHPCRPLLAAVFALASCAISPTVPPERDVPLTELDDVALLETLWSERGRDLSAFSGEFLDAVPERRLRAILEQAIDGLGPVESVAGTDGSADYTLTTATHVVPVTLVRDGGGLVAYRLAVEAGERRRDEVTMLEARHRSWPSGILQDAPAGLPVTLETLATLMISMSDNTATDVLVDVLGRESVEALSPFEPLQTTGEFFKLKHDPALEARYALADAVERRRLLGTLASTALPPFAGMMPAAPLPGAEWYASVEALCAVIERVADEPAMSVPTGLIDRSGWARVADKGGSEQGVLNATTRLVADDGTVWCFAVTWNGEADGEGRATPLDALALRAGVASVVAGLAQEP